MATNEVLSVWYRSLKDGKLWCESSSRSEVVTMSRGYPDIAYERCVRTAHTSDWEPIQPDGTPITVQETLPTLATPYPDGTLVDILGKPVVILHKINQPVDYSVVAGVAVDGRFVGIIKNWVVD